MMFRFCLKVTEITHFILKNSPVTQVLLSTFYRSSVGKESFDGYANLFVVLFVFL